jgi:hypothetical protein
MDFMENEHLDKKKRTIHWISITDSVFHNSGYHFMVPIELALPKSYIQDWNNGSGPGYDLLSGQLSKENIKRCRTARMIADSTVWVYCNFNGEVSFVEKIKPPTLKTIKKYINPMYRTNHVVSFSEDDPFREEREIIQLDYVGINQRVTAGGKIEMPKGWKYLDKVFEGEIKNIDRIHTLIVSD